MMLCGPFSCRHRTGEGAHLPHAGPCYRPPELVVEVLLCPSGQRITVLKDECRAAVARHLNVHESQLKFFSETDQEVRWWKDLIKANLPISVVVQRPDEDNRCSCCGVAWIVGCQKKDGSSRECWLCDMQEDQSVCHQCMVRWHTGWKIPPEYPYKTPLNVTIGRAFVCLTCIILYEWGLDCPELELLEREQIKKVRDYYAE